MRIHLLFNPKLRTDLGEISGKNPTDGLIRPAQELVESVTKTNSKMQQSNTYDEAINNFIHRNK